MNELRYQLDLMRAMNQKLSAKERMYRLLCDTMDYAYIYYSFEKNTVTTLGKWDDFFDFQILDRRDFVKLQEMVDEPYVLALREMLFWKRAVGRRTLWNVCRGERRPGCSFPAGFSTKMAGRRIRLLWYRISPNRKHRTKSFSTWRITTV